jgi:TonB family protein
MVVWQQCLSCLLAFACVTALCAEGLRENPKLTSFCNEAQSRLRFPALDPATLPAGARFKPARPTVLLGQRIQESRRRLALEGSAVLGVVTNSVGRVAYVTVIESSSEALIDDTALSNLKSGTFSPATLDGKPIRACALIKVTFREIDSR